MVGSYFQSCFRENSFKSGTCAGNYLRAKTTLHILLVQKQVTLLCSQKRSCGRGGCSNRHERYSIVHRANDEAWFIGTSVAKQQKSHEAATFHILLCSCPMKRADMNRDPSAQSVTFSRLTILYMFVSDW